MIETIDALAAVLDTLGRVKITNEKVRQAEQNDSRAKLMLDKAVRAYNLAIVEKIITALHTEGLGICIPDTFSQAHITEVNTMVGLVRSGTRRGGDHYYEYEEPFVETWLLCAGCRKNIAVRQGRDSLIELDVDAFWMKALRKDFDSYRFQPVFEWAVHYGITEQLIKSYYGPDGKKYRLGDSEISYRPKL